ncbi:MAG: ABC-2 transporter permease [Firmicutes bacterium]|nr:ABC-2 transporter permease [Bacillota bacterium]HXL04103.1 ABC-2 transporter permease [Bacillota bacterium]
MLDLIYKDIIQNRKLILLYALMGGFVGLVMMAAGSDGGVSIFGAYIMISTYGFATRSTYDEDKSGAYLFLKSLPLSDGAIVTSKFVSVLVVSVLFVIFFNIIAVLGGYLASSGIISSLGSAAAAPRTFDVAAFLREITLSFAIVFSMAIIVAGAYLVMFFWAGFAKANTYSRAILLAIFLFVTLGVAVAGRLPAVQSFIQIIETSSWVPAISIIISLAVYWVCCAVSISRVKAKDWS